MSLQAQLIEDMKTAMKARDSRRLEVIRFLRSELKNVEIDSGELSEEQVQKIIRSQLKKIEEAQGEFQKAGRDDLATAEAEKAAILKDYLPAELSDAELERLIDEVKASNPELDRGPLTGKVMQAVAGRADGGRVATMIAKQG